MNALGRAGIAVLCMLPSIAFAVDVPELPMKVYGVAVGSGTVDAYVGDAVLASTSVVDGTVGYAPNIFLIPGTVPEGTTVVLKANGKELQRFAFEHGGSQEVSLTIPAAQSSVAAAAMIIVDEVAEGVSSLVQTSATFVASGAGTIVATAREAAEQALGGVLSLFSPSGTVGGVEASEGVLEGEREGFVTYTGQEEPQNQLLAAAGAALPNGAWPWIGGILGLLGLGGLAFVRFRG